MARARFMNTPEDYEALKLNPEVVEPWEDGRRGDGAPASTEVWYFDAALDDGTKVIIGFQPKSPEKMAEPGDFPGLRLQITPPDGRTRQLMPRFDASDCETRVGECHLDYAGNTVTGDFSSYDVHIDVVDGLGVDLHYQAQTEPFRQGSGIIALGDADEYYYTDLSVPRSTVTGTITVDGETRQVAGEGYHDHQWMNISPVRAFHHWLWGRLFTDTYSVMIYDFVGSAEFDFTRLPMFGVYDHSGKKIFEGDGTVTSEVELYHEDTFDKDQPKTMTFHFTNGDLKADMTVGWTDIIEKRDTYGYADAHTRAMFDKLGIRPSYTRFSGYGELTLTFPDGTTETTRGDMIYEFPYNGTPDPRAHL